MAQQEQIELVVSNRSALQAVDEINKAFSQMESGVENANKVAQGSFEKISQYIVQATDKATKATLKHVEAVEKQAAAYGKTPIEKLNVWREREIRDIQKSTLELDKQTESIKRLNTAFDQMIAKEKKGGGFSFSNLKDAFTDPMGALKNMFGGGGSGFGGAAEGASGLAGIARLAGPIAVVTGAVVALGEASEAAAKKLGEYALQVKEVELRTGLTAKQVSEFSYAAKAVGKDISVVEGTMRGLTNTLLDTSRQGDKNREWLAKMGVTTHDLNGNMRPTAELLKDIGKALGSITDPIERNKQGMEIFKRQWIEIAPFMLELSENTERFKKNIGTSITDETIEKWSEYHKKVLDYEALWSKLTRKVEAGIAGTIWIDVKTTGAKLLLELFGGAPDYNADESSQRSRDAHTHWGPGGPPKRDKTQTLLDYVSDPRLKQQFEANKLIDEMNATKTPEQQLEKAKQELSDLQKPIRGQSTLADVKKYKDLQATVNRLEEYVKSYKDTTVLGLLKQRDRAGAATELERLQYAHEDEVAQLTQQGKLNYTSIDPRTGKRVTAKDAADQAYEAKKEEYRRTQGQKDTLGRMANERMGLEAQNRASEIGFRSASPDETKDSINAFYTLLQNNSDKRYEKLLQESAAVKDGNEERRKEDLLAKQKAENTIRQAQLSAALAQSDKKDSDDRLKKYDEELSYQKRLIDVRTQVSQREAQSNLQFGIKYRKGMQHSVVGGERARISEDLQDRLATAELEKQQTEEKIKQGQAAAQERYSRTYEHEDQRKREQEQAQKEINDLGLAGVKAKGDYEHAIDEANRQYALDSIDLWNKHYDDIKGKTEGLVHTMFTDPQNFSKQFKTTLRDAALKPIEERISSTIAGGLTDTIFGKRPTGDTKLSDLKGIGKVEDSMKVYVTNLPGAKGGSGGGYSPASWSGGGFSPASMLGAISGGFSPIGGSAWGGVPSGAVDSSINFGSGPESLGTAFYGGSGGAVTTPPFIGDWGSSQGGGLGGLLGGGQQGGLAGMMQGLPGYAGGGKGLGGILGNIKGIKLGTLQKNANGKVTGVGGLAGAGLMMGGTYLAERGLMGKDMGTTKGMFEGAAGGAMVGFEYGGPLGAAIGGAVGAGIGIGEKVAGVESPENEAKRLVKQIYHVTIDTKMAQQIVQVANSKYAKHVSIAVRDPEIRKMLELYASGTGQSMAQSASTPHAGSLSEQGGVLSQDATYQYGKAYSYQSNLPISGGLGTTTYPGSGGNNPIYISMNASGQNLAQFMTGSYVTPDLVNSQWGAAQGASQGRTTNSATMQNPGLIVG